MTPIASCEVVASCLPMIINANGRENDFIRFHRERSSVENLRIKRPGQKQLSEATYFLADKKKDLTEGNLK